jgi:8-oxo-dGTP diphosphatase
MTDQCVGYVWHDSRASPVHDRHEDEPMPPERYQSIVDVHMLLRRDGKILLLRRAGDTWASGQLCLPSGHVEDGENVLQAVIRETEEECGIAFAPDAVRLALSIHQRHPGTSHARIGFAFEPIGPWGGEPVNAEPHKHSELVWVLRGSPDVVPCCVA